MLQRTSGDEIGESRDTIRSDLLTLTGSLVYDDWTVGRSLSNGHHVVSSGHSELSTYLRVLVNAERSAEHHTARSSCRLVLLSSKRRMAARW